MCIHILTYPYTGVTKTDRHTHTQTHTHTRTHTGICMSYYVLNHLEIQDFKTRIHGFCINTWKFEHVTQSGFRLRGYASEDICEPHEWNYRNSPYMSSIVIYCQVWKIFYTTPNYGSLLRYLSIYVFLIGR